MPGLIQRTPHLCNPPSGSVSDCHSVVNSSYQKGGVDTTQLHKFWKELTATARHDLLRIDKHTLFEQVRKNMYCSRCNGFLLEAFLQIVSYSKSHQGQAGCHSNHSAGCNKASCGRSSDMAFSNIQAEDDVRDPSVHPWGGLTVTRDTMLTILGCFLDGPLEVVENVCDCARARERERELLYPDACGGGGRGWISQGNGSSGTGRGHGLKESCALHTARLSCDALVDFWSALGEETRRSLLRMKEEDFIARLMSRFESKRFCRDCRRNVLKELKELKELKRSRKEPKCTRWFCNADTAFRYEVSNTSVHINWKECFGGDVWHMYQHFEWGLGSAEGNSDILEFEDVGLSESAKVDGLDLSQLSLFYITLRAWRHDGRCTEVSVKAHGLKGKQCVHRRLLVGDGHVTITKGESIKRFFEHAEEAEEEEDEDGMDKGGSDPETDGYRVQKHAKSPELAREFLLDAATIIFKEQVEKAFREGTARQNAHTMFVCLALNLLEERIYVACKEISTLEKQKKLLEEEEHEKREEEQRRERKKLKEKERKMRKKEKQKGREREKEKAMCTQGACVIGADCGTQDASLVGEHEVLSFADEDAKKASSVVYDGMIHDDLVAVQSSLPESMEMQPSPSPVEFTQVQPSSLELTEAQPHATICSYSRKEASDNCDLSVSSIESMEDTCTHEEEIPSSAFLMEHSKFNRRRTRMRRAPFVEIVSRRFVRRSSVTEIDSSGSSRDHVKLSCTSVREMSEVVSERVYLGSQRLRRGAVKPDRSMGPNPTPSTSNMRYHPRQDSIVSQTAAKRTIYVKAKHKDTSSWVGTECFSIKSYQKKNGSAVLGSKKASQMGGFSLQGNWQAVKASSGSGMKRAVPDQFSTFESEIVSLSSSSESEKASDTGCKESILVLADGFVELPVVGSEGHNRPCSHTPPGNNLACSVGKGLQKQSAMSADHSLQALKLSSSRSSLMAKSSSQQASLCTLVPISTDGVVEDDSSPSSAASRVTDTSDGGLTSYSMTTESSNPSSQVSTADISPSSPGICEEGPIRCSLHDEGSSKFDLLPIKLESGQAFGTIESLPCAEFHPYSNGSRVMAYAHQYPVFERGQMGVDPDFSAVDVASHACQSDSPLLFPMLPASLLPMHAPQSLGFPWIPGQCVTPFLGAGILPLPHHPGSLCVDGYRPVAEGMTTHALLPPPPAAPPVMGFTCLPGFPPNPSLTYWGDQGFVFTEEQKVAETVAPGVSLKETGFTRQYMTEEQHPQYSGSHDAVPASNMPSDLLGFSLFHFGSLSGDEQDVSAISPSQESSKETMRLLGVPCARAVQNEGVGVPKPNMPIEEYSLFAATPSSRFRFF